MEEDTATAVTAVDTVVDTAVDTVMVDMGATAWAAMEGTDTGTTHRPTTTPWGMGILLDTRIQGTGSSDDDSANHCGAKTAHPPKQGGFLIHGVASSRSIAHFSDLILPATSGRNLLSPDNQSLIVRVDFSGDSRTSHQQETRGSITLSMLCLLHHYGSGWDQPPRCRLSWKRLFEHGSFPLHGDHCDARNLVSTFRADNEGQGLLVR
jgi:hypothetical protein